MAAVQATVTAPTGWWHRVAPVACGCALAAGAGLVALNDPAAAGSRFPPCAFRVTTGLWCPGCGLTRGFHQLFTGHPLSALSYNLFVPLVLIAVLAAWGSWLRSAWGHGGFSAPPWLRRQLAITLPVLVVAYGVLRNIPIGPLAALAP
jgi:hypothetical protein